MPTLAISRELLQWLREAPQWSTLDWRLRAMLNWQAGWGSINARLSKAHEMPAATPDQTIDPVLILGPWRSGTTVMHELLTAATSLATPRTWQCMNPGSFQFSRAPRASTAVARPMDGLTIDAQSPQEDEFALLALGTPSAYRAFWQPGRIDELSHMLDPEFWSQNPAWLNTWEAFLRGVLRTTPGANNQLILKSPNHTYRLPAIARRFPQARVVWMMRPAVQVFLSNRKMWRTMFALHGLSCSPANDDALDYFLVQAIDRAAQMLAWCSVSLPPTQWGLVQQEKLRVEPGEVTTQLCKQLGLPTTQDLTPLREAITRIIQGRVEQHAPQALSEQALAACHRLDEEQAIMLDRHGSA